jgi:hypothetical protein
MHGVEEVAVYAIMLREAGRNHHTGPDSLLDDVDSCRGELSLATLMASDKFTELDWSIAEMLYHRPEQALDIAQRLYESDDPLAAEALLHAVPPNGKRTRACWDESFRERWAQVRASMAAFEREGLAIKFDDVDAIVDDAYRSATGASQEEVIDNFYTPAWDEPWDAHLRDSSLIGKPVNV